MIQRRRCVYLFVLFHQPTNRSISISIQQIYIVFWLSYTQNKNTFLKQKKIKVTNIFSQIHTKHYLCTNTRDDKFTYNLNTFITTHNAHIPEEYNIYIYIYNASNIAMASVKPKLNNSVYPVVSTYLACRYLCYTSKGMKQKHFLSAIIQNSRATVLRSVCLKRELLKKEQKKVLLAEVVRMYYIVITMVEISSYAYSRRTS